MAFLSFGLAAQNFDTTGLSNWPELYNSYTQWEVGAFNQGRNPQDFTDFGWGNYDITSHVIEGDSIYILKTTNGDFKAISVDQLASGVYTLTHANLDGSQRRTVDLERSDYEAKYFFYYSIDQDEIKDLEPNANAWDLVFTKYPVVFPGFGSYGVAGVLHNRHWQAAQVATAPGGTPQLSDTLIYPFSSDISAVGYDWKDAFAGVVYDSIHYYLRDTNAPGTVRLLQFEGYGGSSNGKMVFSVDGVRDSIQLGPGNDAQVYYRFNGGVVATNTDNDWDLALSATRSFSAIPVRINDAHGAVLYRYDKADIGAWQTVGLSENALRPLRAYPNPAVDQIKLDLYSDRQQVVEMRFRDQWGRVHSSHQWSLNPGMNQGQWPLALPQGVYILELEGGDDFAARRKILIAH